MCFKDGPDVVLDLNLHFLIFGSLLKDLLGYFSVEKCLISSILLVYLVEGFVGLIFVKQGGLVIANLGKASQHYPVILHHFCNIIYLKIPYIPSHPQIRHIRTILQVLAVNRKRSISGIISNRGSTDRGSDPSHSATCECTPHGNDAHRST